ncbi:MAG TPA: FAD-binding oxidoreductase [Gaiellaceae bacterium]|nr:FAD-binding oxidoreductase [Gaiellaceae bacterium]
MAIVEDQPLAGLEGFSGELLRPGSDGYDEARRVHNGMIDKRPALVARCRGTADVVAAVNAARVHGWEVSVRGGGHNVGGTAVTEGGLMIDLSLMKGIHVDPAARTARAQGGVVWRELNRETQLHGLAVTGGAISTTGIAGLTLGGGLGWLMAKLGLAADNLLSVELVTAGGSVLTASEDEHPDLFWGLRGGGGNFGVATSFEYRVHPIGPMITGGLVAHPIEAAGELMRFVRDFAEGAPDELMLITGAVHAPDGSGLPIAVVAACHCGTLEQAEADLKPVLEFGSPLMVQLGPMPYEAVCSMLDDGFPKGALNYWKSTFLSELSDIAVDTMVERFTSCPSPMSAMIVEHFHGEVTRVPLEATAVPHRQPGYNLLVAGVWPDADATDANVAWVRETYAAMQPFAASRRWLNYLASDDIDDVGVRAAYGPNYERLTKLKATYDPDNLFHLNANIKPA